MPAWTILPFAGLLLAIAFLPLLTPKWWDRNRNKAIIAFLFGLPVAIAMAVRDWHAVVHAGLEYVAFVSLLGALFVISGGVRLQGLGRGTPWSNAGILALGAVLANLCGTTGASMLLIRPYLAANASRTSKGHLVVFFIFVVSNIGGVLTPLGDPPLFLGFLHGVPFTWTLRLWKEWALACGLVIAVFLVVDTIFARRERPAPGPDGFRIEGLLNLLLLVGVVGVILAAGLWIYPRFGGTASLLTQAAAMSALAGLSMAVTPRRIRIANEFTWHPLVEVLVLFAGIFAAMMPALVVLRENGPTLGLEKTWQLFWASGALSAILDNAPTYLAFLSAMQHLPDEVAGTTHHALAAISCGVVFCGALTYIGNGPNLLVRAIAEHSGVKVPSFFAYMLWAVVILVPLFVAVTLLLAA